MSRVVETGEYVSLLRELTEEGRDVALTIAGNSMSPFLIHGRDRIRFRKVDRPLQPGDMVFYQRESGQYVMHRICRKKGNLFWMVGDAQTQIEGPVRENQIFARIFQVERKGRILEEGDWLWDFFAVVWIRVIPLRPVLRRLMTAAVRIRHMLAG